MSSEKPRLHSEFASGDDSPGLLLWQVTNRWQAAQRAALAPFDLTHVQFVLLAALAWLATDSTGTVVRDEHVQQRDLAAHAATDPMMTSQVLRALEDKGLIDRRDHPRDRRAKSLVPTAAGIALANRALVAVEACDRQFFGPLDGRIGEFAAVLRRLRDQA